MCKCQKKTAQQIAEIKIQKEALKLAKMEKLKQKNLLYIPQN